MSVSYTHLDVYKRQRLYLLYPTTNLSLGHYGEIVTQQWANTLMVAILRTLRISQTRGSAYSPRSQKRCIHKAGTEYYEYARQHCPNIGFSHKAASSNNYGIISVRDGETRDASPSLSGWHRNRCGGIR